MKIKIAFILIMSLFQTSLYSKGLNDIIKQLNSNNPQDRSDGIMNFSHYLDERDAFLNIDLVLEKLKDKNVDVRLYASIKTGELFLKYDRKAVMNRFRIYNPKRIKFDELYRVAGNKAVKELMTLLNDTNDMLIRVVVKSLGRIGPLSYKAVPLLIKKLKHNNIYVREEVVIALGNIGPLALNSVPHLKNMRTEENKKIFWAIDKSLKLIEP